MDREITLLPGNIVYGGDHQESITQSYRSLGHLVLERLQQHGETVLYINGSTGEEYSASFLRKSAIRMAYILKHFGVQQNDVVGLCVENSVEFLIAVFACFALNATVTPMNVTYTEGELYHTISLSKPKVLFASNISLKRVVNVSRKFNFVKTIIATNRMKHFSNALSFHALMKNKVLKSQDDIYVPKAEMDDVSVIYYSSGTTGLPKGVLLSQISYIKWFDLQISTPPSPLLKTGLTVLPWSHVYGGITLFRTLASGTKVVFFGRFELTSFLKSIQRHQVTHCFLVPTLLVILSKDKTVPSYDLSSVKVIFCGAGALNAKTVNQALERTKIPLILQGYGLTETTFGVVVQDPFTYKVGSIGRPFKGVYLKVVDPSNGQALSFNQPGEICIKSHFLMKGYLNDEKATEETIKDGWLHTGDIGYFDEDFHFFIVDRNKELIKYKANQVAPAELEAILLNHNCILDAAVVGKPDEECGELPTAFVVKDPKQKLTEKEVFDYVAEQVSPVKRLRGGVIFISEIPKTFSGKILRRELKAKFFSQAKL